MLQVRESFYKATKDPQLISAQQAKMSYTVNIQFTYETEFSVSIIAKVPFLTRLIYKSREIQNQDKNSEAHTLEKDEHHVFAGRGVMIFTKFDLGTK